MVGYGMAALLCRAFWPASRPSLAFGLPAIAVYLWLGLAMSGPIILLRRSTVRGRRRGERAIRPLSRSITYLGRAGLASYRDLLDRGELDCHTGQAKRIQAGRHDLVRTVPLVVALGMRVLGLDRTRRSDRARAWTHAVGVVLLMTWPIAWICLIVLGKALP